LYFLNMTILGGGYIGFYSFHDDSREL
jgi:hypothetical protein